MRRIGLIVATLLACDADSVPPAAASVVEAPSGTKEQRFAALRALRPGETRAGHPRFADPILKDPSAAEVFGERLADPRVPAAERVALAEALPRCGGAWARVGLDRLEVEPDAAVRAVLISGLQRATGDEALAGARVGLTDPAATVRRAAAELAGWVPSVGEAVRGELTAALADDAGEVRAAAARALGLTGDAAVFDAVARGLADGEAQVRLESLRALRRIDDSRAGRSPAALSLQQDPDERVRRAARRD